MTAVATHPRITADDLTDAQREQIAEEFLYGLDEDFVAEVADRKHGDALWARYERVLAEKVRKLNERC